MLTSLLIFSYAWSLTTWNDDDWQKLQWEERAVIVFGNESHEQHKKFVELWNKESVVRGCMDRRLRLLIASPEVDPALRRRAGINSDGFALALIGLDGGVKFRSTEALAPEEIFERIDRMPMRRAELRRRDP